jgi:hypothetical protein
VSRITVIYEVENAVQAFAFLAKQRGSPGCRLRISSSSIWMVAIDGKQALRIIKERWGKAHGFLAWYGRH